MRDLTFIIIGKIIVPWCCTKDTQQQGTLRLSVNTSGSFFINIAIGATPSISTDFVGGWGHIIRSFLAYEFELKLFLVFDLLFLLLFFDALLNVFVIDISNIGSTWM